MVTKIIKEETSVRPPQPIRRGEERLGPGRRAVVGCPECLHLVESLPLPRRLFIVCLARGRSSGTQPEKKEKAGWGDLAKTHGHMEMVSISVVAGSSPLSLSLCSFSFSFSIFYVPK